MIRSVVLPADRGKAQVFYCAWITTPWEVWQCCCMVRRLTDVLSIQRLTYSCECVMYIYTSTGSTLSQKGWKIENIFLESRPLCTVFVGVQEVGCLPSWLFSEQDVPLDNCLCELEAISSLRLASQRKDECWQLNDGTYNPVSFAVTRWYMLLC